MNSKDGGCAPGTNRLALASTIGVTIGLGLGLGLVGAVGTLGGCGSEPNSRVVEYCIPLEQDPQHLPVARVVLAYQRFSAEQPPTPADTLRFLVATESAQTVVDRVAIGGRTGDATGTTEVERIRLGVADAVSDRVAVRAAFWDARSLVMDLPPLGPAGQQRRYDGILGGNLLRKYAVRLHLRPDLARCRLPWEPGAPTWPSITFSPDYSDKRSELALDGYGVIRFNLAGGGNAVVQDAQFDFKATRVAVGACVQPQPFDPTDPSIGALQDIPVTGVDAYLLIASGTQPLVLSDSFYDRLEATKTVEEGATWIPSPQASSIFLGEGETFARQIDLQRVVLVGNRSSKRGPCAELQQRRWIEWAERCRVDPACYESLSDRDRSRGLGRKGSAVLEVDVTRGGGPAPAELPAYVISDDTVLFWGLRSEIGTEIPIVDGLVGAAFLEHFEVIIDYPNSRLIMRCAGYKGPVRQRACDPSIEDPQQWKSCCLPAARLGTATCCDTRSLVNDEGHRIPRSCKCANSPCCQYHRLTGEQD